MRNYPQKTAVYFRACINVINHYIILHINKGERIMKTDIIKNYTKIKGQLDYKTTDFCFKIVGFDDDTFKLPNGKNHPTVVFQQKKSHTRGYCYYVGTILRCILKDKHGLCLYSHTYDGLAVIELNDLKKSFLSACKEIYSDKEIKQLMRNVA